MDRYKLERELIRDEGWRSKPYKCTKGHWTIGVGHKMHPGELVGRIRDIEWSSEKIFQTLEQDIQIAIRGCEMIFGRSRFESFSGARQRALVNMCFQMGTAGLEGFERMIQAIFNEDWTQANNEALDSKWARSDSPKRAQRVAKMILEG
ncbi:MAG: glycoside hydrolase family protein [Desulfomicrobium apsheronum]|nr:glycoside hydrolase family protein [Desulfomicrobium apsheronum]